MASALDAPRIGGLEKAPVAADTVVSARAFTNLDVVRERARSLPMHTEDVKSRLRTEARARRDAVGAEERSAWSARLAQVGAAALRERVVRGMVVSAYWPMRSEADPRPLAHALAVMGARLCLPAFVDKVMEFRRWDDGDELVPAGFSTFEPRREAAVVAPALVLAPLLAFDARGGRLGWGKGYYDRALNDLDAAAVHGDGTRPFVVGIGFACQQVAEIPIEAHDRLLDAVVTEQGFHRC